jgi:NDP-sugar pyrophosphorylase family protein
MNTQAVILAGGLGTRLGDLTGGLPKPMVDINGRPFLEYELALLRKHGIEEIVLCVAYQADKISDHLGDGSGFGVHIQYSVEQEELLGTAGAVKQAEPLLNDVFFLAYADSYLEFDYEGALEDFDRRPHPAMMIVFRNDNHLERSNVIVEDGLVKVYDKENFLPQMAYINFGVSVLRKEALDSIPQGKPYSQEEWYQDLIKGGRLAAFETRKRFYEIGSPAGLAEFRRLVSAGVLP